jgi:hypothetical protein
MEVGKKIERQRRFFNRMVAEGKIQFIALGYSNWESPVAFTTDRYIVRCCKADRPKKLNRVLYNILYAGASLINKRMLLSDYIPA